MDFKLTYKYSHAKRSKSGTCRSWKIYFINDVEIFRQRVPFDENNEFGASKWCYENQFIQNGRLHQTRYDTKYVAYHGFVKYKERKVTYPLSKKKLHEMGVPMEQKIELIIK